MPSECGSLDSPLEGTGFEPQVPRKTPGLWPISTRTRRRDGSRKREFGSDSRLLAPPCGGSVGLGAGLCVPFPTPEDGEQESRLAPIGRHLVRPLRGGVLRTRCFPRQAAFQGGHEIDDGRRLAAFRRGRPAAAGCYRGHAGFPDPLSLSCGLLWPYGVARRGACEDRAAARDHARGGEPFSKAAFQAMACYGSSTWIRQD